MTKKVDVKNFIMSIDNFISPKACDFMIEGLTDEKQKFFQRSVISNKRQSVVENVEGRQDKQWDGRISLQYLTGLQFEHNKDEELGGLLDWQFGNLLFEAYEIYTKTFVEALSFLKRNELNIQFSEFKFQETQVGGGFHMWHSENITTVHDRSRILVWSLFLNDVEEGGELEFLHYGQRLKPKKGSIVIFPAYFTHTHRGNPPISNTKYIATGWYYTTVPKTDF